MIKSARNSEIFKRLSLLSIFINSTDSDDMEWNADLEACNIAIERIKGLVLNDLDYNVVSKQLIANRFCNHTINIQSDRIYVCAEREDVQYARDFMLDDLAKQHDQTQFIVDWFISHKLRELICSEQS